VRVNDRAQKNNCTKIQKKIPNFLKDKKGEKATNFWEEAKEK